MMNPHLHLTAQSRLSDIVLSRPSTMTVLARLGIGLGMGDATIESESLRLGIGTTLLATLLATALNDDITPDIAIGSRDAEVLNEYLAKSTAYHRQVALPNIERHFEMLVGKSGTNNNLEPMLRFFHELKREFTGRDDDEAPADEADSIENRLGDLMSMIVMHLQGSYDANLAMAVLLAVAGLRDDIALNNRIGSLLARHAQHAAPRR